MDHDHSHILFRVHLASNVQIFGPKVRSTSYRSTSHPFQAWERPAATRWNCSVFRGWRKVTVKVVNSMMVKWMYINKIGSCVSKLFGNHWLNSIIPLWVCQSLSLKVRTRPDLCFHWVHFVHVCHLNFPCSKCARLGVWWANCSEETQWGCHQHFLFI